jgi:hypothetical protein
MSESVGSLWTTQIPSLSETADIQAALRLYHYGAASYNPANTNTGLLTSNSGVAYWLQSLRDGLDSTNATVTSTLKSSTFTAKGQLLSSSAASALSILNVGSNDQVLTADSSTASGLAWKAPAVTLTNAISFSNKSIDLANNTLSGTTAQFNTALSDADFVTDVNTITMTNKTLTSPALNSPTITLATGTASTTNGRFIWDSTNKKFTIGDGTSVTQDFPSSTLLTNAQSSAYTLVLSDKDKVVEVNSASAANLTVPTNSVAFPIGTQINLIATGAGQITVTGAALTTSTYLSGGAAAATTVVTTYNPNFTLTQPLTGTGFATGTTFVSNTNSAITTGTYYFGGANLATSVIIREFRSALIPNLLLGGTGIAATAVVSSTSDTTTDTATYSSGGASAATTVTVLQRLPLVIAGQKMSGTGLTSNQTVSSIAEATIVASLAYSSGGANGSSTFVLAANTSVAVGQRITGTGITGNVYVASVSTGATTTITLGQNPVVSGIGTVSYSTYNLNAQAAGNYVFYGATITFAPAANAQIAGSVAISGTTINYSPANTGQVSGTITAYGSQLTFTPAASSQISGTITGLVTVNSSTGTKLRTQWSLGTLVKRGTDTWLITGDVVA